MSKKAHIPRFIVFDGGEGSGKSTQIKLLHQWLSHKIGIDHVTSTREPGGTPLGDQIRKLLIDPQFSNFSSKAEALLYAASRAQHIHEIIAPALNHSKWVICDRYVDASLAYQGVGRKLGILRVENLNNWATSHVRPDLSIILDIDPQKGLSRASKRQDGQLDRLEQEKIEFHREIRQYYLERAHRDPEHYLVIDAEKAPEDISTLIRNRISDSWL